MNVIKRSFFKVNSLAVACVCGALTALPVLAQEQQDPLSDAKAAANDIGSNVSELLSDTVLTNVKNILLASLGVWGLILVVRWIRRGAR